jgi:hypothetical protein
MSGSKSTMSCESLAEYTDSFLEQLVPLPFAGRNLCNRRNLRIVFAFFTQVSLRRGD